VCVVCLCMRVCGSVCAFLSASVYVCVFVFFCVCARKCVCVVWLCVCVSVCECVCVGGLVFWFISIFYYHRSMPHCVLLYVRCVLFCLFFV